MNKEQFEQLCRKEQVNPATPEPCWFHPNKPMSHCGYVPATIDGKRRYVHVHAHKICKRAAEMDWTHRNADRVRERQVGYDKKRWDENRDELNRKQLERYHARQAAYRATLDSPQ